MLLSVQPATADFAVAIGGSVAIDSACFTLEQCADGDMRFNAVAETLSRTTFTAVTAGKRVNLERAALLGSRLDGHLVYSPSMTAR